MAITTLEQAIQAIEVLQSQMAQTAGRMNNLQELSEEQLTAARQALGQSVKACEFARNMYRVDHYGFLWKWNTETHQYEKTTSRICTPVIADEAITNEKVADGTLTGEKFQDSSISGEKIKDNTVPGSKLADGSITGVDLKDGTLSGEKLMDDSVPGSKLEDDSIEGRHIMDNSVPGSKIKDGTIENVDIKDGTLSGEKIKDDTIQGTKLADGAVDESKLVDNSITTAKIAPNAVTEDKIEDNSVTNAKIASNAVTTAKIGDGEVHENHLAPGAVTTAKLADGMIEQLQTITDDKPVSQSVKPIQSGAVFNAVAEAGVVNISEVNKVDTTPAVYSSLSDALAAVPASVKKGGMSIKFILRTNTGTEEEPVYKDEYVQYRLMATAWSIVVRDWQGVDDIPTPGSDNLVKSGGVESTLYHQIFSEDVVVKASGQTRIALREFDYGNKIAVRIVSNTATLASTATIQASIRKADNTFIYKNINTSWTVFETTESLPFNRIYTYINGEITQAGTVTLEVIFKDAFNANIFDTIPTENSKKAIESGAVYAGFSAVKNDISELREDIDGVDNYTSGGWIGQDGLTITSNSDYAYSNYIDVTEGDNITVVKGTSDIDLYVLLYPVNEGDINSFTILAASTARSISVPSGYNRLRFSFSKDKDAKVSRGSTVIWRKTHEKGIAEKLDDAVQVVEQSFTTEQQNQAKANIGLPPAIDEYPTFSSKNLVSSDGVVKGIKDSIVQSLDTFGSNFFIGYKVGSNGAIIKDAQYCISEYIPVNAGSSIVVSIGSVTSENVYVGIYSDTAFVTVYSIAAGTTDRSIVVPENATRLILTFPINANAFVRTASETVWESNSFSLVTKDYIEQLEANIESTTNNNSNRIKALEDNIYIFGSSTIDIVDKRINSNNMIFNLSEPRRTFKLKLSVPDGTDMTNYHIYVYEPDGTRHSYSWFVPNTEAVFTDKGFDVARVAISQTVPNNTYTGVFTFSVYEYNFVRIEDFNNYKKGIGFDEREIIPDYYFANDYLQNKVAFIKNLLEKSSTNGDAFFFQTDEHWENNAHRSPALIKYLSENLGISRLFDGGDTTSFISTGDGHIKPIVSDFEILRRKTFKGSIYHAVGNHEYLTGNYSDITLYQDANLHNWVDFSYFNNIESNNIIYGDIDKHYYYVDNKQKKIRYIILSAFKQDPVPNEPSAGYYNIRAEADYDNAQLDWFTNTALNVEQGWTILIFTHYFCGANRDGRDSDNGYFINTSPNVWSKAKPFARAMLNYSGNGEIAAIIQGHTHYDGIWHVDDALCDNTVTTGKVIPCIASACDAYYFAAETEKLFNRTLGTITEQAFEVVVLDKTQKKLTFVRIGAPAYDVFTADETGNYPLFGDLEYREVTYGNV